jgi:hypothetical protein
LEDAKQLWTRFRGNDRDESALLIKGKVTSAYASSLLVLKMMLDRKLIESGLWNDVRLKIQVVDGARLTIEASDLNQIVMKQWIDAIASRPPSEPDLEWAREAAIHHMDEFLMDLQSLAWEWNGIGVVTDIRLVSPSEVQDTAKLCLQSL